MRLDVIVCTLNALICAETNHESSGASPKKPIPAIQISVNSWWEGEANYEFDQNGSIRFKIKRRHSRVNGSGSVTPEQIERLIKTLEKVGFFRISEESIERKIRELGGEKSRKTDQRTWAIEIHYKNQKHLISYYDPNGVGKQFPKATDLQTLNKCIGLVEGFLRRTVQFAH